MTSTNTKTSLNLFQAKNFSINKTHLFSGSDYQFSKNKMIWYLQSLDLEVWKTIIFSYTFPTKNVYGNKIQKPLEEYNDKENKEFQLNSRAIFLFVLWI